MRKLSAVMILLGVILSVSGAPRASIMKGMHPKATLQAAAKTLHHEANLIPIPGTTYAFAWDVDDQGVVSGYYEATQPAGPEIGFTFLIERGKLVSIAKPGEKYTSVPAINNAGLLVGNWGTVDRQTTGYYDRKRDKWTLLPDFDTTRPIDLVSRVSESGLMLGSDCDGTFYYYYSCVNWLWDGNKHTRLDVPFADSLISGLNDRRQMVGFATTFPVFDAFLLDGGGTTALPVPDADQTVAWAINNHGQILMGHKHYADDWFIYGIYQKGSFLELPQAEGSLASSYNGINSKGTVVGLSVRPDGSLAAVLVEPR